MSRQAFHDWRAEHAAGRTVAEIADAKLVAEMEVATRGGQYMSGGYRELVTSYATVQSVGRTRACWDNAAAE